MQTCVQELGLDEIRNAAAMRPTPRPPVRTDVPAADAPAPEAAAAAGSAPSGLQPVTEQQARALDPDIELKRAMSEQAAWGGAPPSLPAQAAAAADAVPAAMPTGGDAAATKVCVCVCVSVYAPTAAASPYLCKETRVCWGVCVCVYVMQYCITHVLATASLHVLPCTDAGVESAIDGGARGGASAAQKRRINMHLCQLVRCCDAGLTRWHAALVSCPAVAAHTPQG
jgi:hypothetical protein